MGGRDGGIGGETSPSPNLSPTIGAPQTALGRGSGPEPDGLRDGLRGADYAGPTGGHMMHRWRGHGMPCPRAQPRLRGGGGVGGNARWESAPCPSVLERAEQRLQAVVPVLEMV